MPINEKPKFCRCGEELVEHQETHKERNVFTGVVETKNGLLSLYCPKRYGLIFEHYNHDLYYYRNGSWLEVVITETQ